MRPEVMTRDQFIEAHRAECRRYFAILVRETKLWRGPRSGGPHGHNDLVADLAAKMLKEEAPTLQDRMKDGSLVVLGFER